MHAQINCWSSQGYIYMLGHIQNEELRNQVSAKSHKISAVFTDRHNRELAVTVTGMVKDGSMKSLLELSQCSNRWDFTPLLTSFNRIMNDQPHEDDGVYDQTTCFAFHQPLIATLLAYGKALGALSKAYERTQRNMEELVTKCSSVQLCGKLLSKIASTEMHSQCTFA